MNIATPNLAANDALLAVDVGNSRVKLGRFLTPGQCVETAQTGLLPISAPKLPEPDESLSGTVEELVSGGLRDWLPKLGEDQGFGGDEDSDPGRAPLRLAIASVCPPASDRLLAAFEAWAESKRRPLEVRSLTNEQMPIPLRVAAPQRVGVDRVAAAVAACRLRRSDTPAIVVDLGTAITVDLISADGAFEGGAILPGPALAARSLAEATAGLPLVRLDELDVAPSAVGDATEAALEAGLFWGAVGAIRELIARQRDGLVAAPQVFLTGGAAPSVARLIGGPDYTVRHVAHLTLAGIAVSAGVDPS